MNSRRTVSSSTMIRSSRRMTGTRRPRSIVEQVAGAGAERVGDRHQRGQRGLASPRSMWLRRLALICATEATRAG